MSTQTNPPSDGHEHEEMIIYVDPNANQLPDAAKLAIEQTLRTSHSSHHDGERFLVVGLRQQNNWAIATVMIEESTSHDHDISYHNHAPQEMFSMLLVHVNSEWRVSLDSDPQIQDLLNLIPLSELSDEARQVIFLSALAQSRDTRELNAATAQQQSMLYKFPWRAEEKWKASRGYHGCCNDVGQKVGHSIDFIPMEPSSNDILSAANGTIKYICNDGHQVYAAIATDGTINEMLGYRHLDASTVPEEITGQCSGTTCHTSLDVEQGQFLGKVFHPPHTNNTCQTTNGSTFKCFLSACGVTTGLHLHLSVPTIPFQFEGAESNMIFQAGSNPSPPYISSQSSTENDAPDQQEDQHETVGQFPDVPPGHHFFNYIETLFYIGAVNGFSSGVFMPDANLARGEAAKILIRTMNEQYVEDELADLNITPFPDVNSDNTFYPYIMRMKELGMTNGFSDGTYRPDADITRGEVTKLLVIGRDGSTPSYGSCIQPFPDVECTDTFYPYIRRLKEIFDEKEVSLGFSDGLYRQDDPMSRAGMAKLAVVTFDWEPIFPDVQYKHTFYKYIQALYHRGFVHGYSDGEFKPDENVTRGQLAKMVTRSMGINPSANDYPTPTFPDVPRTHTFYAYIEYLAEREIINGYTDNRFGPDDFVTREQAAKFIVGGLVKVLGDTCEEQQPMPFPDVPSNNIFYDDIRCLAAKKITTGFSDGTYKPGANLSRGAAAKFVYLAFVQRTPTIPQENDNAANGRITGASGYQAGKRYSVPYGDSDYVQMPATAVQAASTAQTTSYQIISTAPAGVNANLLLEVYEGTASNTPIAYETGKGSDGGTHMLLPVQSSSTHYLRLQNEKLFAQEGTEAFLNVVEEPCPEDISEDDLIDIADIQKMAARWNNAKGDELYDWRHNLNGDDLIDIGDIQKAAALWNVPCNARAQHVVHAAATQRMVTNTSMQIQPASVDVVAGQESTVYVEAVDVNDLGGFDFEMQFDPTMVQIDAVQITDFPASTGRFFIALVNQIDQSAGTVEFAAFSAQPTPAGVNGRGNLVEITLTGLASGNSILQFRKAKMTNVAGDTLFDYDGPTDPEPPGPTPEPTPTPPPSNPEFDDVADDQFGYDSIYATYDIGIADACVDSPLLFCPEADARRSDVAKMLVLALRYLETGQPVHDYGATLPDPPASERIFTDVTGQTENAKWIKVLKDRQCTNGFSDGSFKPDQAVKRNEMAYFLLKCLRGAHALDNLPFPLGIYDDVPVLGLSSTSSDAKFAAAMEEAYWEGWMTPCDFTREFAYCPEEGMTRDHVAVMIDRAFVNKTQKTARLGDFCFVTGSDYVIPANNEWGHPPMGEVEDEDIVCYHKSQNLFKMYYNGTVNGMDEDINGIYIPEDGEIHFSTTDDINIVGIGTVEDHDIVIYEDGRYRRGFNGSNTLCLGTEDIDGLDQYAGNYYISTVASIESSCNDDDVDDEDISRLYTNGNRVDLFFDGEDISATSDIKALTVKSSSRIYMVASAGREVYRFEGRTGSNTSGIIVPNACFNLAHYSWLAGERMDAIHVNTDLDCLPPPAPVAKANASVREGIAPLTVSFTDESTGLISSRAWDFGNGQSSTAQNPNHTFQTPGTYTVRLTATGDGGSDTAELTIAVHDPAPIAAFSATPLSGVTPLQVQYTDQSTNSVSSYQWDLGDGQSSIDSNPLHTYTQAGTYTVRLTVTGPGGEDTITKENLITVQAVAPVADFTPSVQSGNIPLTITFTNNSQNVIDTYTWSFGDGSEDSHEESPTHVYTAAGFYDVTLTVTGPGGSHSKTIQITVNDPDGPPLLKRGDLDGSGEVLINDVLDAIEIYRRYATSKPLMMIDDNYPQEKWERADVYPAPPAQLDGEWTIGDVIEIIDLYRQEFSQP
ncbi:MAG: S-layer homology domain-containing protein [Chloroflexota bacterium]